MALAVGSFGPIGHGHLLLDPTFLPPLPDPVVVTLAVQIQLGSPGEFDTPDLNGHKRKYFVILGSMEKGFLSFCILTLLLLYIKQLIIYTAVVSIIL